VGVCNSLHEQRSLLQSVKALLSVLRDNCGISTSQAILSYKRVVSYSSRLNAAEADPPNSHSIVAIVDGSKRASHVADAAETATLNCAVSVASPDEISAHNSWLRSGWMPLHDARIRTMS
jgi:hypothetical protein